MSSLYNTEPPPSGKLLFQTSQGDLEVELFSKECPLACRNIIALALEGYYDNTTFHRLVPGFIIQGGDPTGTGTGGESVYGENFKDESHQRLRFNRRGLLACANEGEPDTNGSQFFFTLDATPELQHRNTLFGRIAGPTIYNLVSLASVEVKPGTDEPVYPPKLRSVRVLENPFDDIVPRITREEKAAQERARREALQRGKQERQRAKKGTKNAALLSFGEAEEGAADEADPYAKGPMSAHDLIKDDRKLSKKAMPVQGYLQPATRSPPHGSGSAGEGKGGGEASSSKAGRGERRASIRDGASPSAVESSKPALSETLVAGPLKRPPTSKQAENERRIAELESSLRSSSSRRLQEREEEEQRRRQVSEHEANGGSSRQGRSLLEEMRAKYTRSGGGGPGGGDDGGGRAGGKRRRRDDDEAEAMLRRFQQKVHSARPPSPPSRGTRHGEGRRSKAQESEEIPSELREYGASDDDDEDPTAWRSHEFRQVKRADGEADEDERADDYITLDPLDPRSKEAIELGFGGLGRSKERDRERVVREGRRGRDWTDGRGGDAPRRRERDGAGERGHGGGPGYGRSGTRYADHHDKRRPHHDEHSHRRGDGSGRRDGGDGEDRRAARPRDAGMDGGPAGEQRRRLFDEDRPSRREGGW